MESKSRLLLIYSLGGLLLLTAVTGAAALATFARVRTDEDNLRARFLDRSQWLEQLRAGILLSGTLARDYFVETDPAEADTLRLRLDQLQQATRIALERCQAPPSLRGEVAAYWKLLDLMAQIHNGQRHGHRDAGVDAYFRRQLAQRRETMLQIAADIGRALAQEWKQSESALAAADSGFRRTLAAELALVVVLGLALSTVTARRLLRVEREARGLSAQLVRAQEEERRAISRELHDEVGQQLSGILLDLGKAAAAAGYSEGESRLRGIAATAERTVDAIRRIALSLRPSMLDDLGLVPALEWQAREVAHRTGLDVEVNAADSAGELPESHRTCIYRVAQEALQNCARHAEAHHIRVGLERAARAVSLRVEDDGRGFQVSRTRGLGLLGMEERVAQLGGRLRVQSTPGRGTTVLAELPL